VVHADGVIIDSRFNGPPDSANGGVTCGLLAQATGLHEVTLRRPPPLGTELQLSGGRLLDGEHLVAEAVAATVDLVPPPAVSLAEAVAARARFQGLTGHAFPTCFVCGPDRTDGLGLKPGPVGEQFVASDWTPADNDPVMVWAALDCPSGWSVILPGSPMLLGRMSCRIDELPAPGEAHVVQGWRVGGEGRKALTGSALYDASGRVLAVAQATWIAIG